MQIPLLLAQCISVNIPILSCECKIRQTFTGPIINHVMHHYQGMVKVMGPGTREGLVHNCPALLWLI